MLHHYSRTTIRMTGEEILSERLQMEVYLTRLEALTRINLWNRQALSFWLRTNQHLFIYTLEPIDA